MGDATRNNPGLSTPCSREQKKGAIPVKDRFPLFLIQLVKISVHGNQPPIRQKTTTRRAQSAGGLALQTLEIYSSPTQ
jgi:hypothetical protein